MIKISTLKLFVAFSLFFSVTKIQAQVSIGADHPPKPQSVLELRSEYAPGVFGGMRLPQLSSIERDLIIGLDEPSSFGLMIYNTTINCVQFWNGSKWISLCEEETQPPCTPISSVTVSPHSKEIQLTCTGIVPQGEENITFTASPSDADSYEWYVNGVLQTGNNSAIFNYTVPAVAGEYKICAKAINACSAVISDTATIMETAPVVQSITLLSTVGTNNQTVCSGNAITNITYTTTAATGATITGLPNGATGNWANDAVTLSGTPTESGTFNYTVTLTGGCGTATATGTIMVTPPLTQGNPENMSICTNVANTITLAAATGGSGSISYNWQQSTDSINWTNAPGTRNTANYTISANTQTANTYYRRQATTALCGTITSAPALISSYTLRPDSDFPEYVVDNKMNTYNPTGASIKWATHNVNLPNIFTTHPTYPGMLYQANRNVGWSVTNPLKNSEEGTSWSALPSILYWEPAQNPCPAGWRLPTNNELSALVKTAVNGWTLTASQAALSGLGCTPGVVLILQGTATIDQIRNGGFNPNEHLYFPLPGFRDNNGSLNYYPGAGYNSGMPQGYIWSASPSTPGNLSPLKLGFGFANSSTMPFDISSNANDNGGYSVRCVKEEIEPLPPVTPDGPDDTPPTGFNPYVGAFWKCSQTGERLIRIAAPGSSAANGKWAAQVVVGTDWIILDKEMTGDANVGWRTDNNPNELFVQNGNDAGFDVANKVSGNATAVTGTLDANNPIYFRIGLKDAITDGTHRYGMVVLTYKDNTLKQRIWIRQGEGDDYVMRNSDAISSGGLSERTACRQLSPYNLTVPQNYFNQQVYQYGTTTGGATASKFTDYPSQAGALFQWASENNNRVAWNPITTSVTATLWNSSPGTWWNATNTADETCPQGYHRPADGVEDAAATFPMSATNMGLSEMRQSLWSNPDAGIAGSTANNVWGYYADGFFDRRQIGKSPTNSGSLAVSIGYNDVAYIGRLFYNPNSGSYASIFFPAAGCRSATSGSLDAAGKSGYYWSSSSTSGRDGWSLNVFDTFAGQLNQTRSCGYSIRCVKNNTPLPPGGVDYTNTSANSYILNPPASGNPTVYRIPISQVNRYWGNSYEGYGNNPANTIGANDNWAIDMIWSEDPALFSGSGVFLNKATGTGYDDYFELGVPAGVQPGNFVLGIQKTSGTGTGQYLWSWHFWVTDYQPDKFNKANITAGVYTYSVPGGQVERYEDGSGTTLWNGGIYANSVMMDRNLGYVGDPALKAAHAVTDKGQLYYQYGRKDPFPAQVTTLTGKFNAVNTVSSLASPDQTTIPASITTPWVFNYLVVNHLPLNWTSSIVSNSNYLWNDPQAPTSSNTGKSIYDPCPPGWKLPVDGVWSDFTMGATVFNATRGLLFNNGMLYWPGSNTDPVNGQIWYPYAGAMNKGESSIYVGEYWTASPTTSILAGRGMYFYDTNDFFAQQGNPYSITGCTVRCVKDVLNK